MSEVMWGRSSFCDTSNCVEVAKDATQVLVRDSKDQGGPVLSFTRDEWEAFISGAKDGQFDL